ncbi:MAG TPA: TolC family protein [Armatimonadota bacterium]|jgi:outer membrane protein TolC
MSRAVVVTLAACILLLTGARARAEDTTPATPLTFTEAVSTALAHNPSVREASSRTAGVRASSEQAQAALRPQVRLDSRYTMLSRVPEIAVMPGQPPFSLTQKNTLLTTVSAQQVLYSGGRLGALVRQASDLTHAAEANAERARELVVYGAERAFLLLVAAQRRSGVAQQTLTDAQEHLRVAQVRLDARAVPQFDVTRAEVQVQEALQGVIDAQTEIETTHAALLDALGLPNGHFTALETGLFGLTPVPAPDTLVQLAQISRPEIRAFSWQVRSSEAAIQVAKGERKPTVSLNADYQMVSPQSPSQIDRLELAAVASLPVWDGGTARAKMRAAEAQRAETLAAQDSLRNEVSKEVRQAYAEVQSAVAQIAVAQKRVQQAEELARIAIVRYDAGVNTAMEVADAQTQLTQARLGLTRALTSWGVASADLRLAVGAPIPAVDTKNVEGSR